MIELIRRDQVLAVLKARFAMEVLYHEIAMLPSFPAPNPEERYDRNIMGQSEPEFWDLIDKEAS